MTTRQKKILSFLLKTIIVFWAAIFIYGRLSDNQNLKNFSNLIDQLKPSKVYFTLSLIVVLMFLNWFIESIKWQYLIAKVQDISLLKAIESVFCGLTWAVFTPNRIGEYGGRIFFLKSHKRIKGIVAMSVGHIAQMVITNIAGALAFLWFIHRFLYLDNWVEVALLLVIFIFCLAFGAFYFNIHWLSAIIHKISFLRKFRSFFRVLTRYSKIELLTVMGYSLARFAVFTSQYLLVIHLLLPELSLLYSAFLVFILFFIQSALPSLDLLDIGVRSLTATYFFSFITTQDIAIMSAAALIWLVNLIIPAIFGAFFVFKIKFFGNAD